MKRSIKLILIILFIMPATIFSQNQNLKHQKAKEQVLLNLKKEYEKLKLKEQRLIEQEKRLKRLELKIIEEQQKITKIQKNIEEILKQIKEIRDANVNQLAIVYSKMKPQNAADVINNMPTDLAVKIFLKMQPNKIAKILNLVNRQKAISITEKLALHGIKIKLRGQ